ncbi:hypothetical protein EDD16DRAFT_1522210 [Pisolithus croceorrhizus]|nr:hypothetical protein EDD16DRAFT_1522210 [Pisolithus croceorrhizus]KAI6111902.1 hypothetical protein EV401DRAFT_1890625 [Pisolithus croceorrhizus]KAI6163941.1 hypothetical protein EDD17DRAFT_1506837 [Pisolithus thermaeus]
MFAAHKGQQHVIGLIIMDDLLYLWHYDQQGPIQCSGCNFIQDLPYFLVLLLVLQCFKTCHWGLNPHIDPEFRDCPDFHKVLLHDEQSRDINITLELSSDEWVTHFSLNGWATNVFPAKSEAFHHEGNIIAKVCWAEELHKSEPEILKKVYEIAEFNEDVKGHVPQIVHHCIFLDTSTAVI